MSAEPALLELKLNYRFNDPGLLRRALTHSSQGHETRQGLGTGSPLDDNEQLEFLGDSVLGFLVAEALVRRFPEYHEGDLSRLKGHLVSAAHLHGVARRLELGSYLELGRSEETSGGRSKKTLLVDGLEAVMAAIYLDGGVDAARAFVAAHVLDAPFFGDEEAGTDLHPAVTNYKSALEELARTRRLPPPRYTIVRELGPAHLKTFTVEARVGKEWTAQAEGRTKKVASQRAARSLYERLMGNPTAPLAESPAESGAVPAT